MTSMSVTTPVQAMLSWDYEPTCSRSRLLSERAAHAQWSATTDVDWSLPVPFGDPLPDDSPFAMASFEASPMARRGRPMWDSFRWEVQSWMVSQFLHGEQGALVVAGRLVESMPVLDHKVFAAGQAVDEARHVQVFARYLRDNVPEPYPISAPLASLLGDILADQRWDVTALGMQIMVEALAMAAFRLANDTFHDDLIRRITRLVARDEARHVSFGVLSLEGIYGELTTAELADREELVLEAAALIRRRFLLGDVWERLDVDQVEGMRYAATNSLMIRYRQAVFAKIVTALGRIGLMTDRVRDGFAALDLLGYPAGRSAAAAARRSPTATTA